MPDFTSIRNEASPLDFTNERLEIGDTLEFPKKMNRYMSKLESFTAKLNNSLTDLSEFANELNQPDVLQARAYGFLSYKTKSALFSSPAQEDGRLAWVWSDIVENNGLYGWNGSAWEKSPVSPLENLMALNDPDLNEIIAKIDRLRGIANDISELNISAVDGLSTELHDIRAAISGLNVDAINGLSLALNDIRDTISGISVQSINGLSSLIEEINSSISGMDMESIDGLSSTLEEINNAINDINARDPAPMPGESIASIEHNSRYISLLANGLGQEESNYNFPGANFEAFDEALRDGYKGGFVCPSKMTFMSSELIEIDANHGFIAGFRVQKPPNLPESRLYSFLGMYDRKGREIQAQHTMYRPGTFTELAEPALPTDTVLKVVDASGYNTSDPDYNRIVVICDYTDEDGFIYRGHDNYSRWVGHRYRAVTSIDTQSSPHKLHLAAPLDLTPPNGGAWPAGTKIRQGLTGGAYKYLIANYQSVDQTPRHHSGVCCGIDYSGSNQTNKFSPGTVYIRMGALASFSGDLGPMRFWGMYIDKLQTITQDGNTYFLDRDRANGGVVWKIS